MVVWEGAGSVPMARSQAVFRAAMVERAMIIKLVFEPPPLMMTGGGCGPWAFDGIRLAEDRHLPPRPPNRVDVIDHRGRVMQIIDL